CGSDAAMCRRSAGGDPAKLGACAMQEQTCAQGANASADALAKAFGACFDARAKCGAGMQCESDFRACIGQIAADAGLPPIPSGPPGLPSGLPGGLPSGLPPLPSGLPPLPGG